MSMDSRSSSALFKRAEQLKRWEESETNREPEVHPNGKTRKIKFPAGCVFLAACAAGDKDEVLKLLKKGADIDTTNVDGLSALHQVGQTSLSARLHSTLLLPASLYLPHKPLTPLISYFQPLVLYPNTLKYLFIPRFSL
jgi:alpha-D-ribose 1-methylphosphonate 5-phosphate C-P lyase